MKKTIFVDYKMLNSKDNSSLENELNKQDLGRIKKIVDYKKSFIGWLKLLFDFGIRSNHVGSDLRYRLLIIFREI